MGACTTICRQNWMKTVIVEMAMVQTNKDEIIFVKILDSLIYKFDVC